MCLVRVVFSGLMAICKAFAESVNRMCGVFCGQPASFRIFAIQMIVKPADVKLTNSVFILKSVMSIYFFDFQNKGPPPAKTMWPPIEN